MWHTLIKRVCHFGRVVDGMNDIVQDTRNKSDSCDTSIMINVWIGPSGVATLFRFYHV